MATKASQRVQRYINANGPTIGTVERRVIEQCHTLPEILAAAESGALESNGWMLPIETVFAPLPQLHVDNAVKKHLLNGCPTSHYPAEDGRYRVYGPDGAFLGLAAITGGVLNVEKLFCERD